MRKSGWAAATGLGSLVLLLAACGGSPSSSTAATGAASSTAQPSDSAQATAPASAQATASKKASSSRAAKAHKSAGPQPSSGGVTFPPIGTTVMVVQKSAIGFVLATASQQVVYVYSKDSKGGSPTCTGSCATTWPPVTGVPRAGPADTFPAQFGVVKGAGGVEQITYNGYPLYRFAGAKAFTTYGNGVGGVWHVVMLSQSDVNGA